jgi:hypothetical protein
MTRGNPPKPSIFDFFRGIGLQVFEYDAKPLKKPNRQKRRPERKRKERQ